MTSALGKAIYGSSHIASSVLLNFISYLSGIKYEALGKENLPEGKAIIVSNHSLPFKFGPFKWDSIDHILIGTKAKINKIIHFIALEKFFSKDAGFLIRKYNELTEQIPFGVKKESYVKMMKTAKKLLNEDEYVGIFSGYAHYENSKKSKLPAKLALETNALIVPAPIKIISKNNKKPSSLLSKDIYAVQILFKKPIDTLKFKEQHKNFNNNALEKILSEEIWKRVYE